MSEKSEYLTTEVSQLLADERGFVKLSFVPNVEINLEQAKEILETRLQLSHPMPQLLLVDLTSNPVPDRPARQFSKSDDIYESTTAMACSVDGLVGKMVGNMVMRVSKDRVPTKLFTSEEEAVNWLLESRLN